MASFKGELRDIACRTVLLRLHRGGRLDLPAPRPAIDNRRRPVGWTAHDATPVRLPMRDLGPLEVSIPRPGSAAAKLFRFLLEQHHYLGLSHVPGESIGYLVRGAGGRELACVLFAAAAWTDADRDRFIGWQHMRHGFICPVVTYPPSETSSKKGLKGRISWDSGNAGIGVERNRRFPWHTSARINPSISKIPANPILRLSEDNLSS